MAGMGVRIPLDHNDPTHAEGLSFPLLPKDLYGQKATSLADVLSAVHNKKELMSSFFFKCYRQ